MMAKNIINVFTNRKQCRRAFGRLLRLRIKNLPSAPPLADVARGFYFSVINRPKAVLSQCSRGKSRTSRSKDPFPGAINQFPRVKDRFPQSINRFLHRKDQFPRSKDEFPQSITELPGQKTNFPASFRTFYVSKHHHQVIYPYLRVIYAIKTHKYLLLNLRLNTFSI